MPDAKPIPMPLGLPAHLCIGKGGFEALCALLDVATREHRQALANAPAIKRFVKSAGKAPVRQPRTAERNRHSLITYYSDPNMRRQLWRRVRDDPPAGKAEYKLLPSLEHAALSSYDATLLTAEPDFKGLADLDAFHDPALQGDDWRRAALAAIPRLRDDFQDWASLPQARHMEIVAAAFAAATLLDDARLLLWAAGREKAVKQEFEFVLKAVANTDESVANEVDSGDDLAARLKEHALALRDAADHLVKGPVTVAMFKVLAESYAEVLKLKEPVLAQTDSEAISELIADFAARIDDEAATAHWLAVESESLISCWHQAYMPPAATSTEQLRGDIDRAIAALETMLPAAATAQTEERAAKDSFELHESTIAEKAMPSRTDRKRQVELSETLAKARKAADDAMDKVLDALKPGFGQAPHAEGPKADGLDVTIEGGTADRTTPKSTPLESVDTAASPTEAPAEPLFPLSGKKPKSGSAPRPKTKSQKEDASAKQTEQPDKAPAPSTKRSAREASTLAAATQLPDVNPEAEVEPDSEQDIKDDAMSSTQAAVWRGHRYGASRSRLPYRTIRSSGEWGCDAAIA